MDLLIWSAVLLVSIFFLVKSADFFTEFTEKIGRSLGMSEFIVGVLIVSIGTSLPELAISLMAAGKNEAGMAAGNVYGSVIMNMLIGLGFVAAFAKNEMKFKKDIFYADLPILVGGILISYFIFMDSFLSKGESILLLFAFIIYLRYIFNEHKNGAIEASKRPKFRAVNAIGALATLVVLVIASNYVIEAAIKVAELVGIGNSEVASSIIATGTSLPEITVAFIAAQKGKFELVVGNIIGSNIFNIFMIPGTFGLITNAHTTPELLNLTIPFCIASVIIYWIVSEDKRITRPEGGFMMLMYVLYIGKLFDFF